MEVHEFGTENARKLVLIPGNMMCWRQFEELIPLLAEEHHVIAVSTDGYDGTGKTTFTTAEASAETLEAYIAERLDGEIDLVFGESFGAATAAMLFLRKQVRVGAMILNGPQYMNIGPLSGLLTAVIPRNQYRLLNRIQAQDKLPWLLKLYTRADDEKLLAQFKYTAENVSLETLQNCTREALRLYDRFELYAPDADARVAVWYGAKEPNMKKAVEKLRRVFPAMEEHPFPGMGHGEVMSRPELMAAEIRTFLSSEKSGMGE